MCPGNLFCFWNEWHSFIVTRILRTEVRHRDGVEPQTSSQNPSQKYSSQRSRLPAAGLRRKGESVSQDTISPGQQRSCGRQPDPEGLRPFPRIAALLLDRCLWLHLFRRALRSAEMPRNAGGVFLRWVLVIYLRLKLFSRYSDIPRVTVPPSQSQESRRSISSLILSNYNFREHTPCPSRAF